MKLLMIAFSILLPQGVFADTQTCQSCSTMIQCPQSAKEAIEAAMDERAQAKKANAASGNASAKKNTQGLKNQQLDPMQKASSTAADCAKISDSCKNAMNAIAQKFAKIQSDLEQGKGMVSSCVNRPLSAADVNSIRSEIDTYLQHAKEQKAITDREAANCAKAEKTCSGMAGANNQNADRLTKQSADEKAKTAGEEKKEGGGGSPPGGGGGGAPPPPPEKKPEEQPKPPVNCQDMANIEKPECKAQRCKLPQYANLVECGADCTKPENQGHPRCAKSVNPSVAK